MRGPSATGRSRSVRWPRHLRAARRRPPRPIGPTQVPARCTLTRWKRSGRRSRSAMTGSRSTTRLERSGEWAKRWGRMHRRVDQKTEEAEPATAPKTLVSTDPATGEVVWSGAIGDAAAEVAAARDAWPAWAAHSVSYRMEALRRFANVVRARE